MKIKQGSILAREILRSTYTAGNGGYAANFGPSTYVRLINLVTSGDENYCKNNGCIKHESLNRCIVCGE